MWSFSGSSTLSFNIIFAVITHSLRIEDGRPVVTLNQGTIQGRIRQTATESNTTYYSFQGVRYAKPPLGKLRFQPPQPLENSIEIVQAFDNGGSCFQYPLKGVPRLGQEDCLYLNIYTRYRTTNESDDTLKPVLFWIHGGGFFFGSGNYSTEATFSPYGPDYFLDQADIVVVTINYRLNVFGFLSTLDEAAQGNAGLKDQYAALNWVRENINMFGGDRDKITLLGHSCGAASASYFMQSMKTRGLFIRGILQSGSSLNRWSILKGDPRANAFKLGDIFGIRTNDSSELVERLQEVDALRLLNATVTPGQLDPVFPFFNQLFLPTVEANHPDAFITESSYQSQSTGNFYHVPTLMGHTTNDGSYGFDFINYPPYVNTSDFENDPELLVPSSLNLKYGSENSKLVSDFLRTYYFKGGSLTDRDHLLAYFTDELFARGIRKSSFFFRQHEPNTYFYRLSYAGSSHGAQMQFIWCGLNTEPLTGNDALFSKRIIRLWTNFIQYGNPTPIKDALLNATWPPIGAYGDNDIAFLDLGNDLVPGSYPKLNDTFWDLIFDGYGNPPYSIY